MKGVGFFESAPLLFDMFRKKLLGCFALTLLVGCTNEDTLFQKLDAGDSGIHFINKITPSDSLNAFTLTNFYNGCLLYTSRCV